VCSRAGKGSSFGPHKGGKAQDRSAALLGNNKNPGPGQYSHSLTLGGPCYSMGSKIRSKDDNWQPAPGTYQPDVSSIKGDARASRFGGGARSDIAKGRDGPGPGAYN